MPPTLSLAQIVCQDARPHIQQSSRNQNVLMWYATYRSNTARVGGRFLVPSLPEPPFRTVDTIVNRFNVTWTVSQVSDPRAGKVLAARQVRVTVTPAETTGTAANTKSGLNKVVNVTAIFSPRLS